jgi:protein TonB
MPKLLHDPEPEYSEEARQAGFSANLSLSIVVDKEGKAKDFQVLKPAGLGLDEKAIQAVQNWKFKPAEKNSEPGAARLTVKVSFRLY